MRRILLKNGTIVTQNSSRQIINKGSILIEGDRIVQIGPSEEFNDVGVANVIDVTGQIIMPGLVNAHTHTAYYIMRGLGMDRILLDWLQELVWPWLMEMDEHDVYTASLLGYIECLKSGTTCLVDNQNYPKYRPQNYDAAAQAALESGLRVTFACGYSDIRFICPPDFIDTPEGIEKECRRMINTWHGKGSIQVCVSPINLLYCSNESIQRGLRIMVETGTTMHTHVAESQKELEALTSRFGKGYIEAFYDMGALSDRFQSVHSVWISPHEIDLLARTHTNIVYNPTANMLLASGIAPITKLQDAGVNVALGTDNPNNNNDMLELMKFAGLLQKVGTLEPLAVPATSVLDMATINGARALHLDDQIGSLEIGKQADIVTIDTRTPHNTPMHDPIAMLVYSANGSDVRNVLIGGQILLKNGQLVNLDEGYLVQNAQDRASAIIDRLGKKRMSKENQVIT